MLKLSLRLGCFLAIVTSVSIAGAQTTSTIRFDNSGAEFGITTNGATDFSIFGSNWSGGAVRTEGLTRLYASGSFSYEVRTGTALVTFDESIDTVTFFYVHGGATPAGSAQARDVSGGNIVGATAASNTATTFAAPANFVTINPVEPIGSILFTGGIIDNFSFTTFPPPLVEVPNVVNSTQANATVAIQGVNLNVGAVTQAPSDSIAAGNVISQDPVAGAMITEGSTVDLVISTGSPVVPDVLGFVQLAATQAIFNAGLTVGTVTQQSSEVVLAGRVISQDPTGGTIVTLNSPVDLVISTGPATIPVPDVLNLTEAAATAAITGAGLTVGSVTGAPSDTVPAGDVISQDPEGGAMVAPGSAVDLVISTGPATVLVPDVVGLAESEAGAAIVSAGLSVGNVTGAPSDTVPVGDVISQDPDGGAMVAPGSAVDLVISTGPASVTVPDVVGLSESGAMSAIVGAGLTVGVVSQASSDTVPVGDVISQNPAGGAMVAPGSEVDLVISTGPSTVSVPDVTGLTEVEAAAAITGAGLTVGTVTEASNDTVPAGDVISQNPEPGATVVEGSAVDLVISTGPILDFCSDVPVIMEQLAELRGMGLIEDFDGDVITEDFTFALMEQVTCNSGASDLRDSTVAAYAINLLIFDMEVAGDEVADYREFIGAAMAISASTQEALRQFFLDLVDVSLAGSYEIVMADEGGTFLPLAVEGLTLAEGYLGFAVDPKTLDEPYSGEADLDGDTFSNATEFMNVVMAEGTAADFANAATDETVDGSSPDDMDCSAVGPLSPGFSGPAVPGADLLLFGLVVLVLARSPFRRRLRT